ncbi:MAG: glycohydrolase toxin TNT-related protein [Porphyromonas sp.]|uniref:glycohydrolase toxin TNT-related protein n=1 Tax=Porphyromonas sp. TaxID=1924944 RepID=UPI001CAC73F0|nr:glycohydrolase toxin TNT-related protein [Porphyromonas sp.]
MCPPLVAFGYRKGYKSQGPIIPWFNHPGQGIQIIFSEDIEELIKKGKIAIRNLKKIK